MVCYSMSISVGSRSLCFLLSPFCWLLWTTCAAQREGSLGPLGVVEPTKLGTRGWSKAWNLRWWVNTLGSNSKRLENTRTVQSSNSIVFQELTHVLRKILKIQKQNDEFPHSSQWRTRCSSPATSQRSSGSSWRLNSRGRWSSVRFRFFEKFLCANAKRIWQWIVDMCTS